MDYRPRLVDATLTALLEELPAILLVGPRACGKTTTAQRHARSVVRLDRSAEAAAFRADPDAALRGLAEPVLLDEWQAAPGVLGAVKRAVDGEPRPGRFLLTGSVRADLQAETWPGTGRVVRLAMGPLTVADGWSARGGPSSTGSTGASPSNRLPIRRTCAARGTPAAQVPLPFTRWPVHWDGPR